MAPSTLITSTGQTSIKGIISTTQPLYSKMLNTSILVVLNQHVSELRNMPDEKISSILANIDIFGQLTKQRVCGRVA